MQDYHAAALKEQAEWHAGELRRDAYCGAKRMSLPRWQWPSRKVVARAVVMDRRRQGSERQMRRFRRAVSSL